MHKQVSWECQEEHSYLEETGFAEYNMAVSIFAHLWIKSTIASLELFSSGRNGEPVGKDPWGGWSLGGPLHHHLQHRHSMISQRRVT